MDSKDVEIKEKNIEIKNLKEHSKNLYDELGKCREKKGVENIYTAIGYTIFGIILCKFIF